MKKEFKIELTIYIIIIIILSIWFGYYQVKLRNADKKLEQIENQYNEITQEYEHIREQYINEIKEVE